MKQIQSARMRSKIHISRPIKLVQWLVLTNFVYILSACTSSAPTSEELIKTRQPTFLGLPTGSFTTGTPAYNLDGECDPISYGIEWSYNRVVWNTHAPGCVAGTFSIPVIIPGLRTVYVRSRTKLGFTAPAIASIRFVLPPTAPVFQMVSSGNAATEGDGNVTFTMGVHEGKSTSTVTENLDSNITGIVYGPQ